MFQRNREECLRWLEEIAQRIDTEQPVNRQFLEANYLIYSNRDKEIGYEKVIERLEECLRYTMPDYDGHIYRVPSIEEMVILNNIALRLKRNGRTLEAMSVYRQIIVKYKTSKVALENHTYSMVMIYLNYAGLLEECNYLKKAERIGKEGMRLMLKVQKGDSPAMFLGNLTCVYIKRVAQVRKELIESCGRNSYYLLQWFHCERLSMAAKKYYEDNYGKLV